MNFTIVNRIFGEDANKLMTFISLAATDDCPITRSGSLVIKAVNIGNKSYDLFYEYDKLIEIIEYTTNPEPL